MYQLSTEMNLKICTPTHPHQTQRAQHIHKPALLCNHHIQFPTLVYCIVLSSFPSIVTSNPLPPPPTSPPLTQPLLLKNTPLKDLIFLSKHPPQSLPNHTHYIPPDSNSHQYPKLETPAHLPILP